MKKLLLGIILPIIFLGCSSDNLEDFSEDGLEMQPISMVCCQASMGIVDTNAQEEGTMKQGRGSEINTVYPSEHLYLIANVGKYMETMRETFDKYEKSDNLDENIEKIINEKFVLEIPVFESGDRRYIDLCFSQPNPYNDKIYAWADGKKVEFNLYQDCVFSSTASGLGVLEKEYKTQGGKNIYEPYEDELFFSKKFKLRKQNNKLNISFDGENGNGHNITKNSKFSVKMNRATALVKSGLLITDMETRKLSKDTFKEQLGDVENWEVSSIVENTSVIYTIRNYINGSHSLRQDFLVSLFNEKDFTTDITHQDGKTKYTGIGYIDNNGSFIFPVTSGRAGMYYTFCYEDNNEKKSYVTLHVNMHELPGTISCNSHWKITTVIDYIDLKKALEGEYGKPSKASIPFKNGFGPVIDIPYKVLIDKH